MELSALASILPLLYSSEKGLNWEILITGALYMLLPIILAQLPRGWRWVGRQVDKIHFTVPGIGWHVNFSEFDLDNKIFEIGAIQLERSVVENQDKANEIKLQYQAKIQAALKNGDTAGALALVEESRKALENLTENIVKSFPETTESALWGALESRFGNQNKALNWVRTKVKSIVEEMKDPAANRPSLKEIVAHHLLGEAGLLGKGSSSPTGVSNG